MPATKVIIRTVTHYYIGELTDETPTWITLTQCSWIADTGRWHIALRDGALNEIEPYPPTDHVRIAVGAIVDLAPWNHPLPTTAK